MALIKVRAWQRILITLLVIPALDKIAAILFKKAEETPGEWDDLLAGAFKTVIEFLRSPEAFEET